MNKFLLIPIFVSLIPFGVFSDSDVQETRKPSKAEVLFDLTEKSIPYLPMDQYLRLVKNIDFNYDVITLFTIKNTAGGRCNMCETGFKSLKLLGRALRKKDRPIFVVGVDMETERQLASMLGLERMPLVHIRSKIHNLDEYFPMDQYLEVKNLQRWILMKTGVEVKIKVPTDYKHLISMTIYTLLFLFLVYLAYRFLKKYIGKNFLAIAGVFFCVLFSAGMQYNVINNSPYMITNKDGEMEVMAGGQRDQTVAECYLIVNLCK